MRSSFGSILPAVFILFWIGNLFVVLPVCSKPLATTTSATASATATVAAASCTDDKTLRFRVKGKTKEKTCKWVANKPQNRCKTKQSNGKKRKLKYLCRQACNNCKKTTAPTRNPTRSPTKIPGVVSCIDDKTRQFRVGGKTRKCNWVAKKPNNRCHKIQTDGKQRQLKRLCRAACHNCKTAAAPTATTVPVAATQNPTRSPTNTPTKEPPTTTTTMMTNPPTATATTRPSTVPTQSPTESPRVVNQDPHPCGCATCTEDVLNTYAGEHKCRDRIQYLRDEQGFTEANACARVGGIEFPTMNNGCGRCDPNRCSLDDNDDDEDDSEEDDEDTNDDEEPLPPRPFNTNNKCGGAVNFSNEDSNLVCQKDLWEPTNDTTMHCFAYGGRGDPCHLSNNNDVNDGLTKDPSLCTTGDTFYLWDEPDTQGKSYTWAGQAWYEYSRRFATELQHIRDAFGIKVTSPLLKAGSEGVLGGNINAFFDACGPACFDVDDPAYIDIIAINAFCGDFNGPAGCRGGAEFITKEATQLYQQYSLPIYITNWSKLGTSHPDDQLEAMDAIDEFFIPQKDDTNQDGGIIERVFWFGATDYGGGSSNNFLTTEISNGATLGDYWYDKCNTL